VASNYDNAAWFYDGLSRVVYGNTLVKAQVYLLQYIQPNSKVLIVGGGTGWILEELTKLHPSGLQVTYIEVSTKMMAISKKRNTGKNQVLFINDAIENISEIADFEVVITPFLFDNFTEQTLQKVFYHINGLLKPTAIWLNTDFQLTGKWWQSALLKSMLLFFKVLCRIESTEIHDIKPYFIKNGYKMVASKTFFKKFITSQIYTLNEGI
jgi:ubiquinone/menaquinone biosynthesis C-methylase UbiE